ncbi:MAG: hypothetical protein FWB96_01335 [Defluviitaleaceae bacterium]|nr:hypothetical protein [Defluviitaleaceae bacterium]MCL2261664.1 hypothetical protein [Defluviitaleaceae bacterium]
MGIGINMHIEVKIKGSWEHYACPHIYRCPELFGLLAGVRNDDIAPICEPKGLPRDITVITQMDYADWEGDAHHASWLNHEEIECLVSRISEIQLQNAGRFEFEQDYLRTYLFGNGFAGSLPTGVEDVRFVFWFDN